VKTGVSDGVQTEILEGLEIGDRVVTGTKLAGNFPDKGDMPQPGGGSNPFMPRPPQQRDNRRTE
jgi:HlyD family secretion protein